MIPASQLTSHIQTPEGVSDPSSICAELQLMLPGELVEIEGKRLRIEAVITRLDIGDVLRHLRIAALTPGQKNIVRYELDTPPSGALASNLAAIISRAKDRGAPAETVVRSIQECLQSAGSLSFKQIEPEKNPFVNPSMERMIPDFGKFARNPLAMDTTFSVERELNGSLVRAVATLYPQQRYTLIEATTFPKGGTTTLPACKFKVRCEEHFWETPRTTEEVVAALHSATLKAMDTLTSDGARAARRQTLDPELDYRLLHGNVNPSTCDTKYTLPSGARVLLEEGNCLACVRLESSEDENSTAFFWRIESPQGLLLANDPRLITTRSAVNALVEGDVYEKLKAIQTLDRLEEAHPAPNPGDLNSVPPFQVLSLEQVAGFRTARMLSHLHRSNVHVMAPNSEMLVLDILDGIHSIQLSPKSHAHSEENPQDPQYLFFGFRSDGALKVTVRSPLHNHLETIVPASYFEGKRSREITIKRLANLFNQQTSETFRQLRQKIEALSRYSTGEVCDSMKLRPSESQFPPIKKELLNLALDTAADIARVYESDVPASISDVQIIFNNPTCCELVVAGKFANQSVHMCLHTSEFGVHAIDLYTMEQNRKHRHRFTLASPITLPEGREVLSTMFKLLHGRERGKSTNGPSVPPILKNTRLFKYLKECEERFIDR